MKYKRVVSVYHKKNENLFAEYSLEQIPMSILRTLLKTDIEDFEILKIYKLKKNQLIQLNNFMSPKIDIDLSHYNYFYECFTL